MICSESELGLAKASPGIMELPDDAVIGIDFRKYCYHGKTGSIMVKVIFQVRMGQS